MVRIKWILIAVIVFVILNSTSAFAMVPYKTYFYDFEGEYYISPDAYVPEKVITAKDMGLGDVTLKEPTDLFVDKDHNIYIADSGNNRILVFDRDYKLKSEIRDFTPEDSNTADTFNIPAGVFVDNKGLLYVADSKNTRIVILNIDGKFNRMVPAPSSDVFPEGFIYEPYALSVDPAGRIFVVSKSTNMGIIGLSAAGEFEGFIGAEKVVPNIFDIFWELITTKEQEARSAKNVPTEYNNITIDEIGFIYVTSSAINSVSQFWAMISKDTSSHYAPIKRLNSTGIDVLKRNGAYPPAGDMNSPYKVSRFIDVALAEDGVYSTLDSTQNKVFTYDENGNLLYAFGGSGTQAGVFQSVSALAYQGSNLLVLDKGTGNLTVFRRTEYGDTIAKAIKLRRNRKYDESINAWQEVLKHNPSFELAYSGVGQSNMRKGNYYEAMKNYKLANNWDSYFKAFREYRKEVVRKYILLIPLIAGILIWALMKFFKYVKKVNDYEWKKTEKSRLWGEILYSFHIMFHPFDGFWDLKHEKRGSLRAAIIIIILVMAVDIFKSLVGGYVFINSDFRVIQLQDTILKILIPLLLWCSANWGLTTLMNGEGSFKDIFIATAYSLMPIVILNIPVAILSNFIVAQELQFVTFLTALSYVWAFGLIFFGVLVTNSYGLVKNLTTSAMSIVGMGFIAFILVMFINILQKMGTFISTVFNEISFRL